MKHTTFASLLLLFSCGLSAQTPILIRGNVTTADHKPAASVSISVRNTSRGSKSDENGYYSIEGLKSGTYTIHVSAVGLSSEDKTITAQAGDTVIVDFLLNQNSQLLEDVIVNGNADEYKRNQPSESLRLSEPLLEVPQNIQVITSKTLADQQVISMSDNLIRNVSGAVRLEHWGDLYANVMMRGSQIQAFRNGFNVVASYWGPLTEDMSFVDHIEFVKGPAGFMLASGDPSGLYNVVTKKPTGQNRGEVTLTGGSYDLYRVSADFDGKATKNGKLLYRINAAGQKRRSHRPFEFNDRYSLAPVLTYQLNNKTSITAEYTLQHARMTEVGSYYVFATDGYATLPRNFTMTQPGIPTTKIYDHSAFLNFQHAFNDQWKLTVQGAYFNYQQEGYSSWPSAVNPDGTIIRNIGIWDAKSEMKLGQAFLNGNVKTGGINHRILAGIDIGNKNYFADWGQSHDLDSVGAEFNVFQPNYGTPVNGYPSFDRITSLEDRAIAVGGLMDQRYNAYYLQDELGFFENRLRLTLAGRYTYLSQSAWGGESDKAKHFSPRLGLSLSIDKETSVYGLYDQAFIPQSGTLRDGGKISPLTGNNTEFGVKRDWFSGQWNTTLSVYRILKNNELTADPDSPPGANLSVVLGQKRAQGIEFDLRGSILSNLNVIANYAYTDSRVTEATPGTGISVGQLMPGFAKHTINSWLTYKLINGPLKGTGMSAGFSYLVDRATGSWSEGEAKLPDYFRLDGGLFWEGGRVRLTGNIFNILDNYLYSGAYYEWLNAYYWQSEQPRNMRVSLTYKF